MSERYETTEDGSGKNCGNTHQSTIKLD